MQLIIFSKLLMKIKLIDETNSVKKESPSLIGLNSQSTTETPEWVRNFIDNTESWQASSILVSKLNQLLEQIPEPIFSENKHLISISH